MPRDLMRERGSVAVRPRDRFVDLRQFADHDQRRHTCPTASPCLIDTVRQTGRLTDVETIPLGDGELRWLFPKMLDEPQVLDILHRAAGCIEQLADHLGVRPSWTGSGLEFHRFPGQETATLFGCAQTTEVSLIAELRLPRDPIEWVVTAPPPWLVNAEISVRCDAAVDCGMHAIETKPDSEHASPVDAANGLLAATTWLLHRGTEQPTSSWRQQDPRSEHH